MRIKKSWMLLIFLGGLQLVLLFSFILPGYDELEYFDEKVKSLKVERNSLNQFVYLMDHYQAEAERITIKNEQLKKEIPSDWNFSEFLEQIGLFQQKLELISLRQVIGEEESGSYFDRLTIRQQLSGKYQQHQDFMNEIFQLPRLFLIKEFVLENTELLSNNPDLLANIQITLLKLKK